MPDPLIPFEDPYTGETIGSPVWRRDEGKMLPSRFGGTDFSVWDGQNQIVWVDVAVPKDAPACVHTGVLRVKPAETPAHEIPVELTVWNFTLPDGAVDIWCPLFGFIHEPSMKKKQARGEGAGIASRRFRRRFPLLRRRRHAQVRNGPRQRANPT